MYVILHKQLACLIVPNVDMSSLSSFIILIVPVPQCFFLHVFFVIIVFGFYNLLLVVALISHVLFKLIRSLYLLISPAVNTYLNG